MEEQAKDGPPGAASFRERSGWGLSEVLFGVVMVLAMAAVFLAGRFAYREGMLLEAAKSNAQSVAQWAEAVAAAHERGDALPGGPCAVVPGAQPPSAPAPVVLPEMADAVAPQGQVAGLEPIAEPMAGTASAAAATAAHGGAHDAAPAHASASAHPAPQAAAHGNKLAESHGESVAGGDKAPEGHADKPAEGAGATAHAGVTWQSCREALFAQSGALAQLSNPFDPANTVLGTKCEKRNAATRGLVLVEKGVPPPPGTTGAMTWAVLEDGDLVAKGLQLRIQVCDAGGYLLKVAEVKL